jgi:ligand-binding sensor domain-containing protein
MSHRLDTTLLVGIATLIPSCSGPNASGEIVRGLGESVWIVFQDTKGSHWFGSDGHGVYRDDGRNITRFTTEDGLCNDHIRQIQEDEAGNVYFNTCGGISKFDGQRFSTLVPIEGGTSADAWKSKPGDLWFSGRQDDDGPYRLDGESLVRLSFPKIELEDVFNARFPGVPYSPYAVYTTYKDSRGSIWFGTSSFGACRFDGKSFTWVSEDEMTELDDGPSFGVRGIVEDRDGKMWLSNTLHRYEMVPTDSAAHEARAVTYRKEKGIGSPGAKGDAGYSYFVSAVRDTHGALWMATYGAGVWRYDGKQMTHYPVVEGGKTVLLYSIHADRQGVLWLGTTASGAFRFNGEAFERYRP